MILVHKGLSKKINNLIHQQREKFVNPYVVASNEYLDDMSKNKGKELQDL